MLRFKRFIYATKLGIFRFASLGKKDLEICFFIKYDKRFKSAIDGFSSVDCFKGET